MFDTAIDRIEDMIDDCHTRSRSYNEESAEYAAITDQVLKLSKALAQLKQSEDQ